MKTNQLKCLFFLGALIFVLSSTACRKNPIDDPTDFLPPETQTGKGTFGCLVNGKLVVPRGTTAAPGLNAQRSLDAVDYSISAADLTVSRGKQYFRLNLVKSANDTFTLSCVSYEVENEISEVMVCPPTNYQLNITRYDNKNRILSGNFIIKIAASATTLELNITEGRFDCLIS